MSAARGYRRGHHERPLIRTVLSIGGSGAARRGIRMAKPDAFCLRAAGYKPPPARPRYLPKVAADATINRHPHQVKLILTEEDV